MFDMEDYNSRIDRLRKWLKSPKSFAPAMELALELHAMTHTAEVSAAPGPTFCDDLLEGLADGDFCVMPTVKDETIAWHLWHIARIEDLVGNLLIAEQPQVFDDAWMDRLHVAVRDTGNAMTDPQIMEFSERVRPRELIRYRNAVGCRTRAVLKSLTPDDLNRKPSAEALEQLVREGGLLEHKKSIWLKRFWGRHTVAGLILLPLTRHHMMHLPDSLAIKNRERPLPAGPGARDCGGGMGKELMEHIDRLHTTEMGAARIRRNLSLETEAVVEWCRDKILDERTVLVRRGKNWYADTGDCRITVNAGSYTIITAHLARR